MVNKGQSVNAMRSSSKMERRKTESIITGKLAWVVRVFWVIMFCVVPLKLLSSMHLINRLYLLCREWNFAWMDCSLLIWYVWSGLSDLMVHISKLIYDIWIQMAQIKWILLSGNACSWSVRRGHERIVCMNALSMYCVRDVPKMKRIIFRMGILSFAIKYSTSTSNIQLSCIYEIRNNGRSNTESTVANSIHAIHFLFCFCI